MDSMNGADSEQVDRPAPQDRRNVPERRQISTKQNTGRRERRFMSDRRLAAFLSWPRVKLGGLPVVAVDRNRSAGDMVDAALDRKRAGGEPVYLTSTNGEVTFMCARQPEIRNLFMRADAIHADGMPHVFVSRLFSKTPLPERVATTDLFFDIAGEAERRGASMFMLGATPSVNDAAANLVRRRFPTLRLVGARDGYFSIEDEEAVCADIVAKAPDILWVSMGAPREQAFVARNRHRLKGVGLIKTSGGLFDFVSGKRPRAPQWMQAVGLEWLWRASLEPRRLGARYLRTNPYALYLLLTRSR
jgi:exopolysaccharide biosynthesis WecB/TagA/CpsF family protein